MICLRILILKLSKYGQKVDTFVFNYRTNELPNVVLQKGMTVINLIINEGSKSCKTLNDRWTVVTKDGMLSSNLRQTVAITKSVVGVLTNSSLISGLK